MRSTANGYTKNLYHKKKRVKIPLIKVLEGSKETSFKKFPKQGSGQSPEVLLRPEVLQRPEVL